MLKFNLKTVEFSKNDLRLGIKIPGYLTEELAYFLGFHVGDGYMGIQERLGRRDYRLEYNGHHINECVWYINFIKPLIKNLFNKEVRIFKTTKSTVKISFRSKAILTFLHNCCEIPLSPKKNISVPKIIFKANDRMGCAFLRGIADTDFSLTFKRGGKIPTISFGTYSKTLHDSIKNLLSDKEFTYYSATYHRERKGTSLITYHIELNGRKKLQQWMEKVGFSSYNTITRYLVWKETGSLPVGTDINDRVRILKARGLLPSTPQAGQSS